MDLLQNPHLRTHVSTSLCLRLLCKIHVSGFMSQHPCVSQDSLQDPCCRIHSSAAIYISGSSTRSTSSDSCLSIFVSHGFSARSTSPDTCLGIHLYFRILCKIHVSGSMWPIHVIHQYGSSARSMSPDSCLSIFVSQESLQDPCLRIHVSASTNMDPLQDPRLRIHVSAPLYLRQIHVSGSVHKHPYVSQDPLQDPCLRIRVSASICISGTSARSMSPDPYINTHMYLRILCKIHVSDSCLSVFISQGPLQDPCLRIHVSASFYLRIPCKIHVSESIYKHPYVSQDPLQDPCLRIHVPTSLYLRSFCKIHVSDSCLSILIIRICGPAQAKRKFWPPEMRFVWPCAGKTMFRAGKTQILTCRDAFFVALRRRNANLTSQNASCVHIMWIHKEQRPDERKSPRRFSETPKKIPSNQFWPPESRFLWPCAGKKRAGQKFAPRPKRLYSYCKNPSVCHTVWGNIVHSNRRKLLIWTQPATNLWNVPGFMSVWRYRDKQQYVGKNYIST